MNITIDDSLMATEAGRKQFEWIAKAKKEQAEKIATDRRENIQRLKEIKAEKEKVLPPLKAAAARALEALEIERREAPKRLEELYMKNSAAQKAATKAALPFNVEHDALRAELARTQSDQIQPFIASQQAKVAMIRALPQRMNEQELPLGARSAGKMTGYESTAQWKKETENQILALMAEARRLAFEDLDEEAITVKLADLESQIPLTITFERFRLEQTSATDLEWRKVGRREEAFRW